MPRRPRTSRGTVNQSLGDLITVPSEMRRPARHDVLIHSNPRQPTNLVRWGFAAGATSPVFVESVGELVQVEMQRNADSLGQGIVLRVATSGH